MKYLASLALALLFPALAPADDLSAITARLDRLERENVELRGKLEAVQSSLNKERLSKSIVTGEQLELPSRYSPAAVEVAIESRFSDWKATQWEVGLKPLGGGFFLQSPDKNFQLRILGYAQAVGTITDGANDNSFESGDFRIRRARVDFLATLWKDHEIFIELDGAPTGGTTLVEARLTSKIWDDKLQLRLGKFTTPFSTENFRSSRAIDTIERYTALNALFSIPALDVQNGAMLFGAIPLAADREYTVEPSRTLGNAVDQEPGEPIATLLRFGPKLTYYVGVWNGNASAGNDSGGIGGNSRDSNGDKEFQAKLVYQPHPQIALGLGYDHNDSEAGRNLTLSSLAGTPFVRVSVEGKRNGVEADFFWEPGRFSLRGEGLYFDFEDSEFQIYGGYLQAAYFIYGSAARGLQPLLRVEATHLAGAALAEIDGNTLTSVTLGVNWFINGNVRFQLNYIGEYFNGPGNVSVGSQSFRNSILTEFQIKF